MIKVEKVESTGPTIRVTGTIDGLPIVTTGARYPYDHAKTPAHRQRYLEQMLVAAAARNVGMSGLGAKAQQLERLAEDGFMEPEIASVLKDHEARLAYLELPWWMKLKMWAKKYFGFDQK